ncbi:MAG: FAD-binding protein [Chloroflexi bacterium]|nr:FAD-binding protein [Chloroflexota bacterium]
MLSLPPEVISTDVLILGGGGAGMRAAIEARKSGSEVLIVSKSRVGYGSNTAKSGAGMASATGGRDPRDNPQIHLRDMVLGGRFINQQRLAEVLATGGPQQVADLDSFGIPFRKEEGRIWMAQSPGHSYPRNAYGENNIGTDLSLPLRAYAQKLGIKFLEGIMVTRLLIAGDQAVGAVGIDPRGEMVVFKAKATILACGGLGQIYLHTNNAAGITGDGYALAYQAGLPLVDMEFVQFYPTAVGKLGGRDISYEAFVFRAGARLLNSLGEDIIQRHRLQNALVRDRLTRAMWAEIQEGRGIQGKVMLDLTPVPDGTLERLLTMLPRRIRGQHHLLVAPTVHFQMGGVVIDQAAHTSIHGLLACGEVCGGVHGANRLGGNALTEIFVFGAIAGREASILRGLLPEVSPGTLSMELDRLRAMTTPGSRVDDLRRHLKETMWLNVGIVRDEKSLTSALREIAHLGKALPQAGAVTPLELRKKLELQNMLTVAEMVCRAALMRTESRGAHFRSDFPEEDNKSWLKNILISQIEEKMHPQAVPVDLSLVPL